MKTMSKKCNFIFGALLGGAVIAAYWRLARPWMRRWGAQDDEVELDLPGDDLVPAERLRMTHAITITAPPDPIWPWLVQIGQGRGGFYSYEWLENLLGLDIHNADQVLPEYQDLQVGDMIPFASDGSGIPAVIVEPYKALVLHYDTRESESLFSLPEKTGSYFNINWGFYLLPLDQDRTRLVERWLVDWSLDLKNTLFMGLMEPGAFLMEQKMLREIKKRAERRILS